MILTLVALPAVTVVFGLLLFVFGRKGNRSVRYQVAVLLVPMLIAAFISAAIWSGIATTERLVSFRSEGTRTLLVTYEGGICEDQRSVSVDESERWVKVGVKTRDFGSGCADVGQRHTVRVRLESPIDSRKVVDAHCSRRRQPCIVRVVDPDD